MIERRGIAAVVTDIEGTTGSIAFVQDVLFPYARTRLAAFIAGHDPEAADALAEIRATEGALDDAALVSVLERWMDEDRKAGPLKVIQGLIWRGGYQAGELEGHVYDDAARALRKWRTSGVKLYVYSSGSAEAQRLLFGHSTAGDLTGLFSGYFDTRVGAKNQPASYAEIAARIGLAPRAILFLTDSPAEIAAASAAGTQTVRLVRDGQPGAGEAASFDEIAVMAG